MTVLPLKELLELADSGVWGDEDRETGISVLRSTNFRPDGRIDFTDLSFRQIDAKNRALKTLAPGDILLEKSGGGPKQPVGRVCIYKGHEKDHAFGNFLSRLRPNKSLVQPEYLFYRLWHFHAQGYTSTYQKQTSGIRNLETKRYLDLPIALPSLSEQRRLVDLLSRAENIVRMRREAEAKAKEVIPALFNERFGRHCYGPAVSLKPPAMPLPTGWRWARLTDVAQLATGHTPSRRVREYWEGGDIPWITLGDIRKLDGRVANETAESTTPAGIENSAAVLLPAGTVCFSRTASVGFVTIMGRPMCTSQDFVNWICGDQLEPTYLLHALLQSRESLRSLASGSTHKTIYFPTVEKFGLAIPPRESQKDFARTVRQAAYMLERQRTAALSAEGMFTALLARALTQA